MKHYKIRQSITDRSTVSVDLYLKDISKYPLLTDEEEKDLIQKIKDGDEEAKNKLVESNLRFVVSIAKQYQGKGVEFADLISAGNMGLLRAVKDFDDSHGFKFLSYAVWWIRNAILKEILDNGKLVRIPAGKINDINRINKAISDYEVKNGIPPTEDEIAELTNLEPEEVDDIINTTNITIINNAPAEDEDGPVSVFDELEIEDQDHPDDSFNQDDTTSDITDYLKKVLTPVEYGVVTHIFGIECEEMTPADIGVMYNITKERVRQIKDKAIIKLRKSKDVNSLLKYFS